MQTAGLTVTALRRPAVAKALIGMLRIVTRSVSEEERHFLADASGYGDPLLAICATFRSRRPRITATHPEFGFGKTNTLLLANPELVPALGTEADVADHVGRRFPEACAAGRTSYFQPAR